MPTAEVLRTRRDELAKREDKVGRIIVADEVDLKRVLEEIEAERHEVDELESRRRELGEALEEEIRADERGKGEHPEHWEEWADSRRDELADLRDASEARVRRMLERASRQRNALTDLRRRDGKLDDRIGALNRRLARKAQDSGQLTKDLHLAEFDCNDGTPVPAYMRPHLEALCRLHLQPLRDSGGSVHINSGYRTLEYNRRIGGASQSYHVYTLRKRAPAADHIQAGRSASAVQAWHEAHDKFDGMGFYAGFTHGDDRGYPSRWWGIA